ncbi:uncharacterized protein EKO05_0005040 [Ascochyta rabiei]|uniref:Uncharacterized protein n=1 Tax=Didymella rabiei TaxID=5454 RepID=A0A163BTH7_DIDRA|nr:uncharacterized protein EKO05_0005040 [Ascochyta rabiei]KZM21975.1 hypothetical protein ST47_g6859 [Ascochyta rabiei]UPX14562.1 hypothetical protein EKO05_0005040 [Ascochyta rabiei]
MATTTIAQGGCRGDTSIYNRNGLTVPFKNLCGKDIQKVVDFLDPTDELTWSDCLDSCVMKAPLCYGFDFTPHGTTDFSCWLMNASFAESDAKTQTYTVDAAMVDPDLVSELSSDCRTLGLQGCFQENGQLGAAASTSGLSTGAKAGIGAGIGAVVLIAILVVIFCVLKRQRRKDKDINPSVYQSTNGKMVEKHSHPQGVVELQAHQYGPYGSPELAGSSPPENAFAFAPQELVYEIDGITRYEK